MQKLREMWAWSLGQDDSLEKGMETHSNVLAWKIPRTEEPCGKQSIGSQRVGQDWSDLAGTHVNMCNWFSLLYTWNYIVNKLYSNKNLKKFSITPGISRRLIITIMKTKVECFPCGFYLLALQEHTSSPFPRWGHWGCPRSEQFVVPPLEESF